MVWFAEYPDRLLCDPSNCLHIYGIYDFKYGATDHECRTQVEKLIHRMMLVAQWCYEDALRIYRGLPPDVVQRLIMSHVPAPVATLLPRVASPPSHPLHPGRPNSSHSRSRSSEHRRLSRCALPQRDTSSLAGSAPLQRGSAAASLILSETLSMTISQDFSNPSAGHASPRISSHTRGTKGNDKSGSTPPPRAISARPTHSTTPEQYAEQVCQLLAADWPPTVPSGTAALPWETPLAGALTARSPRDENLSSEAPYSPTRKATVPVGCPAKSGNGRGVVRVKLFIDVVASRKTIGREPTRSRPYLLGQYIYRYVTSHYQEHVTLVFVGISDANVKLLCRDVLFPFRYTPSAVTPAAMRTGASGDTHAAGTSLKADAGGREGRAVKLLPCVPLPPSGIEAIDQCRLLMCFPAH